MAANQFVQKSELVTQIHSIVAGEKTGYLTIVTDTNRSVLLRFCRGKLTHSNARSKDVADAIQVLNECRNVKFTYADAAVEDRPEIIPSATFLQLIDMGDDGGYLRGHDSTTAKTAASVEPSGDRGGALDADALMAIAVNYVGPIADLIVEEALAAGGTTRQVIDTIADSIPDPGQADEFRSEALAALPGI